MSMIPGWDYIRNNVSWYLSYDRKSFEKWLGFRQPVILHDGYSEDTLKSLKLILGVLEYNDIREELLTHEKQSELNDILSKNKINDQDDLCYPALYVSVPDRNCRFLFINHCTVCPKNTKHFE